MADKFFICDALHDLVRFVRVSPIEGFRESLHKNLSIQLMWLLVFSSMISNTFYNPGKDKQSHLLKHALTKNHRHVDLGNMKIIDSSFHNNKFKRKTNYVKQGNLCVSPLSSLRKTKKEYYSNEKNEKNICNNWTFWKVVNPFQDGPFRDCSRMGGAKKTTPPTPFFLKSVTNILQRWNLAQLYLT